MMDAVLKIIKLGILSALIVGTAYVDQVAPLLSEQLPRELGETVSGVDLGSAGNFFDEMVTYVSTVSEELNPGMFELGLALKLALAQLAVFVIAAIGFLVFIAQKIVLELLVAIGPIFVALFLFEPTRRFFYGWLTQIVNTLLTLVLLFLVLTFLGAELLDGAIEEGVDPGGFVLFYVAFALITLGVLMQVPGLASGIAGGFASNSGMGGVRSTSQTMSNAGLGMRRLYERVRGR